MKNITLPALTTLALTHGVDVDAHGGKAALARLIGCHPGIVTWAYRSGNIMPKLAEAAERFARGASVVTPAASGVAEAPAVDPDSEEALSDEELTDRINDNFWCMDRFVDGAIRGKYACVLVTGPGGIGKTFPVEAKLREYADDGQHMVRMVSGAISAVGLVEALWETRNRGDILLIDDADGGLSQPDFLNVLKAATDTKGRRVVSWMKQNSKLAEAGVEPQFEFEGTVIVISNVNMRAKSEKSGHIDAILSRAIHIDLGITSKRAMALRVMHMIRTGMFQQTFAAAGLVDQHDRACEEIATFIRENAETFRSLTLREAAKLAKIWLAEDGSPTWSKLAKVSIGRF